MDAKIFKKISLQLTHLEVDPKRAKPNWFYQEFQEYPKNLSQVVQHDKNARQPPY